MSQLVTGLFCGVNDLTGRGDENILSEMITAWLGRTEVRMIRKALFQWLEVSADIGKLKTMARETSTHYVWPLHVTNEGYGVAINEFKDPRDMVTGYATILHNHRYSFVSLVLSGGYKQVCSNAELLDPCRVMQIRDLGEDVVTEGDIVQVSHDEFHRLSNISNNTVTLVVKCPAVKDESLSVDSSTLRVTRHVPVEGRIMQLMDALVPANE